MISRSGGRRRRPEADPGSLGWGSAVVAALLAVTALGFLGGLWWVFDLLSHWRPHYAVALTFAAALLAVAGSRRLIWVALAGALLNAALVIPLYLGATEGAFDLPLLRILLFNVTADNERIDDVLAEFEASNADLVFIFEGSDRWEEAIDQAELPYELSPGLRTAFSFANAVLVREGVEVELRGVRVGPNHPRARELDMVLGDIPLRILIVHPPSPTSDEKTGTRNEQLAAVADWVEDQDRAVIVAGDLNATPWSYGYRPLAATGLANSLDGFGLQGTWPAMLGPLGVPIDHLLHSNQLITIQREVGPSLGSEHRSVLVTLAGRPSG